MVRLIGQLRQTTPVVFPGARGDIMFARGQGVHAAVATSFPEHFSSTGKFELKPDEMVFREAPSTLLNAAGEKVEEWDFVA